MRMKNLQKQYPFLDITLIVSLIRETFVQKGDIFSFETDEDDNIIFRIKFKSEYYPQTKDSPADGYDNRDTIFCSIQELEEILGQKVLSTINFDSAVITLPYESYFDLAYKVSKMDVMVFNKDLLYKYNRKINVLNKEQLIYFVIYNASEDSCIDGEKRLIKDKDDLHDFIVNYFEDDLQDDEVYEKFCSIIKNIAEHDLDLINREIINCIEDGF